MGHFTGRNRKAATALFEYSSTLSSTESFSTANPFSGYGQPNNNNDRGGFSSFGFGPSSPISNPNSNPFFNNTVENNPFLLTSSGFDKIDKLKRDRLGREEDDEGAEGEEEEGKDAEEEEDLPELSFKAVKRYNKEGILEDAQIESERRVEEEDEEMGEVGDLVDQEVVKEEWNLGKFLNSMGIDPTLFEWSEEEGNFAGSIEI
jgi:hypothetical protein